MHSGRITHPNMPIRLSPSLQLILLPDVQILLLDTPIFQPQRYPPLLCKKEPARASKLEHNMLITGGARRCISVRAVVSFLNILLFFPSHGNGITTVNGSVYCDQCLEGHRTAWGIPLEGAQVLVECKNSDGEVTLVQQGTANITGDYTIVIEGSPNMQGCTARLLSSPTDLCDVAGDEVKPVQYAWDMFGVEIYSADSLSYKPARPMPFCPGSSKGVAVYPLPFTTISACSHEYWLNLQYRCYWRTWSPDTKAAIWYGVNAARLYGGNLTLEQGLLGAGEPYRVLLRESITATLNALNSLKFYYDAVQVDFYMNQALAGSENDVIKVGLAFARANSGYNGNAKCLLTPC